MNRKHYYNNEEGRWHHVWHQSDLKKLDMCPEQARFIWSGAVNDIQGDGAALGTACHYAVEQVLSLESFKKVFYEDDQRVVTLAGQVDLIDANYGVVDWTFPKRDYTKEKWQYERWDIQSTVYCWAMGLPQMTFFVMHGSSGATSSMTIDRGPGDFSFLWRKIEAACRLVEATDLTVWPLNDAGWWCSEKWAPCWSVCKGKRAASEDANG